MDQTNIQDKLIELIQSLFISEEEKQKLVERVVKEGPSKAIADEVRAIVETSIQNFEDEADREIKKIQDNLNRTVKNFQEEMQEVERDVKAMEKAAIKKKDEEDLEKARKTLAEI